jgi:hypothetical protein
MCGCAESARASRQPRRTGHGLRCRAIPGDSRDSWRRGRRRRCVACNRGPFRPEKRVEERPAFAEHEEDPADGVHVDRVRPVRVHGEREDEPGGGDDLRDSDPHGRVVPAARSSILASRPAMSVAAASGARHRYGNVTIRPHACAKCATEPFAPNHGRCQAPLPKREFFDVARRAVRSHRRRRVSVRGSCPRRRSRGTRRRPRCLPR